MKDEAKPAFSEEQRLVLEQAFYENSYSSGNTLNLLAARLGVDSRRIMGWFGHRRRKENKAIAKKAEAALTWPNYKLSSKKPSLQDSTPGEVSDVAMDDAEGQKWLETDGNALLEGFVGNIRKAESKALDSVCAASIPLLWVPLTQQQVVHCARTLDTKSWDLGSKAAFLLVLTDQVVANSNKNPAISKMVGCVLQVLGKSWVKLFVDIRAAPSSRRLPKRSVACLETALLRLYKQLLSTSPHLATHLASAEAALVFMDMEPTVLVGCGDAVALAIKRKIGRVLAERMLQNILKEVVAKCEWRKTVDMMKGRSKVQIDGEGARRRQSSVVTKMKKQAKMATGKQAVPKKGREKVAKKLAIVKNRVKAKIFKDLSTAERKSPTIKAKKTGLLSLEDLKRRMGSLGTSVSFTPAENVKVPNSKKSASESKAFWFP